MKKMLVFSLAIIIVPAIFMVLVGCMKPPEPNRDFGPQTSIAEILEKKQTLPIASPSLMKVGEYAAIDESLRLEMLPPEVIRQYAYTVVSKKDLEDQNIQELMIQTDVLDLTKNEPKSSSQKPVYTQKPGASATHLIGSQTVSPTGLLDPQSLSKQIRAQSTPADKITYHNVQISDVQIRQSGFNEDAQCGHFPPEKCGKMLNAKKFSYDLVNWSGAEPVKTSFVEVYSDEIPFLANPFIQCASSVVKLSSQWVNVMSCFEVKSMKFGPPIPALK